MAFVKISFVNAEFFTVCIAAAVTELCFIPTTAKYQCAVCCTNQIHSNSQYVKSYVQLTSPSTIYLPQ
jgi:hypothetical protein